MKKLVLLHEIGHDQLHRDRANDCGGFCEYDIFDMRNRAMEYEANLFAAEFLISDEDLYECINCEYNLVCRLSFTIINFLQATEKEVFL